ncbi:hypothetical protein MIC448_810018 [Microbacterium sp. C448]|nr:hypothetical protein MIC448_810018 [Microbacterium sp. C448]
MSRDPGGARDTRTTAAVGTYLRGGSGGRFRARCHPAAFTRLVARASSSVGRASDF